MISILLSTGHSDSSVSLRSGHRDLRSLQSYNNLLSEEGKRQHSDIFEMREPNARGEKPNKKVKSDDPSAAVLPAISSGDVQSSSATLGHIIGSVSGASVNVTINNFHC
eukprot:IDg85t1